MNDFRKNYSVFLYFIGLSFFVSNCAASGALLVEKKPDASFLSYSALQIQAESSDPRGSEIINNIKGLVSGKLSQRIKMDIRAGEVPASKEKDFLKLNIKLISFKDVTKSERLMIGAMAGRATLNIEGEFISSKAKNIVSKFKVEEISSGGTAFAGTTDDIIDSASNRIVDFIAENAK